MIQQASLNPELSSLSSRDYEYNLLAYPSCLVARGQNVPLKISRRSKTY
jgi:hypothetical protein